MSLFMKWKCSFRGSQVGSWSQICPCLLFVFAIVIVFAIIFVLAIVIVFAFNVLKYLDIEVKWEADPKIVGVGESFSAIVVG